MSAPAGPKPRPTMGRLARRVGAVVVLSLLVFVAMVWMALDVLTSAMIASGFGVVVIVGGAASDLVDVVLDAIASTVFLVLGAIAALVAFVFDLFSF